MMRVIVNNIDNKTVLHSGWREEVFRNFDDIPVSCKRQFVFLCHLSCRFQQWQKVPKQFRKYVRISMKQLHKNKGDNPKLQKKASEAGVSPEVREFLQQFLLEWHAKLSHKRPRAVAMEMMEGERSLPAGLEQGHFQWLCRFMARWHRRHAGKCEVMSGWSSGETNDDTSGDEATGCGRKGERKDTWTEILS